MSDEMLVRLAPVDADHLLALAEWALNHPDLDLGPGLHAHGAEAAARRIEAVADLYRRGIRE
jgi:hypothetical protein